jgi:hypothetical protein
MVRTETPQENGSQKKRVFFKVKVGSEHTEYKAVYGGLEFEGVTMGDKKDVKDVVRRMILAYNDPPDSVNRAAILVTNHISSAVYSRAKDAWAGMAVEFGDYESITLSVRLYYYIDDETEERGWAGEAVATFSGNDGLVVDATHKVVKRLDFGENVDVVELFRLLMRVARHAYNAYPAV